MSIQKRTKEEIYAYFKEQGCILLEDYVNATRKMSYVCKCGKPSITNWNHFLRGKRCGYCSKTGRKKKYTLEEVKEIFTKLGCKMLQDYYKDNKTPIHYECKCGNKACISLTALVSQKQNCIICAAKKRTGILNHNWRFDREQKDKEQLFRNKCHYSINRLISRINTDKQHKISSVLGYSAQELYNIIKFEIKDSNWTIDHIFPIQAFFDVNILDTKLVNSLDNLKLSTRSINSIKSDKYNMAEFLEWLNNKGYFPQEEKIQLDEAVENSRYSIEVNFRSKADEVLENFAKISLGYVSAGLKQHNYHIKHVYSEKPIRILVSGRNWDDGEWVCIVSWNTTHKCFVLSKGFYNKDRRTVSLQSSEKCAGENAYEITKHVYNMMHELKNKPDRHMEKLKPVAMKRGPKA